MEHDNGWGRGQERKAFWGTAHDEVLDELDAMDDDVRRTEGSARHAASRADAKRFVREHRDRMLIVQRIINELPETLAWFREATVDGVLSIRGRVIDLIDPRHVRYGSVVPRRAEPITFEEAAKATETIPAAAIARLGEFAVDVVAEALRRAYRKELGRVEAAERLGNSPYDWFLNKAKMIVTHTKLRTMWRPK